MTRNQHNTHPNNSFIRVLRRARASVILMILALATLSASASAPNRHSASFTSIAAAPGWGFWIQVNTPDGKGNTLAVDGARQFENVPEAGTIIVPPGHSSGYWVVGVYGRIYARGAVLELCGGQLQYCSGYNRSSRITGAAASPNGRGFWAVDENGHVWTAGDVISYGDVTSDGQTPSGIVATPSGLGYYIVMSDGGVYSFGDAVFFGSTGGNRPGGHDVTGLALSFDFNGNVNGYWMIADDGAIYTYGDAPFLGNAGVNSEWATSIVTRSDGHSYAWILANGQYGLSSLLTKVIISSPNWGTVWDVSTYYSGEPLQLASADGSYTQQWYLWPTTADGKTVQLVNYYTRMCADVTTRNGYPWGLYLIQYPCKGRDQGWDNQRFTMMRNDAGQVQFAPVAPTESVVYAEGANSELTLIAYQGGWASTWVLTPVAAAPATETSPIAASVSASNP